MPPQLFVGSFLPLIALGTLGLRFLPGLYVGDRLGWVDALFTATSAVCVTGLVVVDAATHFTWWGQAFILLLIQLGGLGMITFTTLIILALGRRISLRQERITTTGAEVAPRVKFESLARDIVLFRRSAPRLSTCCGRRASGGMGRRGRQSFTPSAASATPASPPFPTSRRLPGHSGRAPHRRRSRGGRRTRLSHPGGAAPLVARARRGGRGASAFRCTPISRSGRRWCS